MEFREFVLKRITELSKERKISENEIFQKSSLSCSVYYDWKNNKGSKPNVKSIMALCYGLSIPLSTFFQGYDGQSLTPNQSQFLTKYRSATKNVQTTVNKLIEIFSQNDTAS